MQAFQRIETVFSGSSIEMWTGSTGWPTGRPFVLYRRLLDQFDG
jgi:exo-beta-1,3-glucanase (GH17 family)